MTETTNSEMAEKPEECRSCHFVTSNLKWYRSMKLGQSYPGKWLCHLCASTLAGNAVDYPEQYTKNSAVLECICFVGNTILEAIQRGPNNNLRS